MVQFPAASPIPGVLLRHVPSSQIDNLTIVKVMDAEYPSDYTGGFIIINKEIPEETVAEYLSAIITTAAPHSAIKPAQFPRQLRAASDLAPLPGRLEQ